MSDGSTAPPRRARLELLVRREDEGDGFDVREIGSGVAFVQSRPQRGRPWEYVFFVDLKGHREEPPMQRALATLKRKALFLKVLGSYPEGRPPID